MFLLEKNHETLSVFFLAGSTSKCKISDIFEDLVFWRRKPEFFLGLLLVGIFLCFH